MQSSVYASILPRKHSTAHYFQNGTVYILGGIDLNAMNNSRIPSPTSQQFDSSIIILRLDKKDFSLHSYADPSPNFYYPNIAGHTSHVHYPSNTIISVLGLLLQEEKPNAPPLINIPSVESFNITNLPNRRYMHTSTLINDTLHVIGGKDVITHKQVNDVVWNYSFSTQLWTQQISNVPSMSGHITIVYYQWLISCFGENLNGSLVPKCTWFNTVSLNVTQVDFANNVDWPTARKYASMISLSNKNKYVLFGGQNKSAILDDIWYLHINTTFSMNWKKINTLTNYKRSAHASALIDEDVILYYGGQDSPNSLETNPIYFNITNKEWIHAKNQNSNPQTKLGVDLDSKSNGQNNENKISGGTIGGIITGIACILGLGIAYFVWKKRHQRRQKLSDSRAARFSQSYPPQQQQQIPEKTESIIHYTHKENTNKLQGDGLKEGEENSISLPELALRNNNRISTISLGTEFQFSAEEYHHRHSHHSTDNSSILGLQHTIPKIAFTNKSNGSTASDSSKYELQQQEQQLPMESLTEGKPVNYKRRESTGFNRLTLNLFSNNNNENSKKSRSSSLFQLRSSRLLQPNTPTTPNITDNRYPNMHSRVSLSAKSVSSVQWVGFNDNMDGWRDSTGSSLHLAVTNEQRTSMYHTDSSA